MIPPVIFAFSIFIPVPKINLYKDNLSNKTFY